MRSTPLKIASGSTIPAFEFSRVPTFPELITIDAAAKMEARR